MPVTHLSKKESYDFIAVSQYIIMSVGKHVFSKTAHRIFLKHLMKLGCLKGKNGQSQIFG